MKIFHFDKITSTQDVALKLLENKIFNTLILADIQTNGRGRLNSRTWVSVKGNFHGSFIIKINNPQNSVAVLNNTCLNIIKNFLELKSKNTPITIKIPNDILLNNKKLAGVLIEVSYPYAVIGIGINTASAPLSYSAYLSNISHKEFAVYFFEKILYNS